MYGSRYGNTPTSVGKTRQACSRGPCPEKHPHERGEDPHHPIPVHYGEETPPRAWGRQTILNLKGRLGRNTPTSVGKTALIIWHIVAGEKHPHERGEDKADEISFRRFVETPPRAWGRQPRTFTERGFFRNTPTSVGKTPLSFTPSMQMEKHPHERGEDGPEICVFDGL